MAKYNKEGTNNGHLMRSEKQMKKENVNTTKHLLNAR